MILNLPFFGLSAHQHGEKQETGKSYKLLKKKITDY